MSLTRADVVAYLDRLSTTELAALIDELQRRLGLAPIPPPPPRVVMGAPLPGPDEKTEFDVHLTSHGRDKVAVIKALRELWTIGIQEAKTLVESAPLVLRRALPRDEAQALVERLRRAGAEVELR